LCKTSSKNYRTLVDSRAGLMRLSNVLPLLIFLWLISCASVEPLGKGQSGQLEDDEQRLWKTVLEEEKRLDRSGAIYDAPVITAYLKEVIQKLVPEAMKSSPLTIQVKIVKNPLLNAFAFPNGIIYVHTGILARMENEAQLATLLGHELTHATHRHTIQELRGSRRSSAALATLQMVALPFGVFGAAVTALGAVGYVAAVTGYSRGREAEADQEGLALMVAAGYSPQEAPKLFEHLKRDLEERKVNEPFFFGTHPRLTERVESYSELLAERYAGRTGELGEERYQARMLPLFVENARTDLAIGRFGLAQQTLERVLRWKATDARALYYLGEVFRQRDEPGDRDRVEPTYRKAIEADATYADPHRAIGTLYVKRGQTREAGAELQRYLEL